MPERNPIQNIEDKQRTLRDLRRVLRQPGALDLIQSIFREQHVGENGTYRPPSKAPLEKRGAVLSTGITEAVWTAASSLIGDFTRQEIAEALEKQHYSIASKHPEKAIGEALERLRAQERLTLVRAGRGGKLGVFRVNTGIN
jgi:ubiquinone/menaquinone biosynthesis C-methylase UbiE